VFSDDQPAGLIGLADAGIAIDTGTGVAIKAAGIALSSGNLGCWCPVPLCLSARDNAPASSHAGGTGNVGRQHICGRQQPETLP